MIITRDFVLINVPKTGSTFVRSQLKHLCQYKPSRWRSLFARLGLLPRPKMVEVMLPNLRNRFAREQKNQHGLYCQLPRRYRSFPVVAVARHPFDQYVSAYYYGWWKDVNPQAREVIVAKFPTFPDLSFEDYLKYLHFQTTDMTCLAMDFRDDVGSLTYMFISFFAKDPGEFSRLLSDNFVESGKYKEHLCELTLLDQGNLNRDLYAYLQQFDFSDTELAFILESKRLQPKGGTTRQPEEGWETSFNEELARQYAYRERYLFSIYRDFSLDYSVDKTCGNELSRTE